MWAVALGGALKQGSSFGGTFVILAIGPPWSCSLAATGTVRPVATGPLHRRLRLGYTPAGPVAPHYTWRHMAHPCLACGACCSTWPVQFDTSEVTLALRPYVVPAASFFPCSLPRCRVARCRVARCPLPVVRCPLSVVRCPLSVVRCPLSVVRCPLPVARCPLPVARDARGSKPLPRGFDQARKRKWPGGPYASLSGYATGCRPTSQPNAEPTSCIGS